MKQIDPHEITVKKTKKRFGVDKDGKSIHHKLAGAKGGSKSSSRYFKKLKDEGDEDRLKEIAKQGVEARKHD